MHIGKRGWMLTVTACLVLQAVPVGAQHADSAGLSLEEAIRRAMAEGEEIKIATAQIEFAEAQIANVRADALPQLSFSCGYNRQIKSVFRNSGFGGNTPNIRVFTPDPSASVADRVTALEGALPTAGLSSLLGQFSDSPFGRLNTWNSGFTINQTVFEGNRLWAAPRVASRVRDAAEAQFKESQADVVMSVSKAYFSALLAERAVSIARLGFEQAERQLDQLRRQHREGTASDFELLQGEVQRDNQMPEVVAAEEQYRLRLLDLKRLVNLSSDAPTRLTSGMQDPARHPVDLPGLETLLARVGDRAAVEAARHEIEARRLAVGVARSDFWPRISLFSNYSRQAFPTGLFPGRGDWRTDWSVGFNVDFKLFDGLRTRAKVSEARANLSLAREQHAQVEESVRNEVERAYRNLSGAKAQIEARRRTVEQGERALRLAEIRLEEGISTPLEVSDARFQLQRARMNHLQAFFDYNMALIELERAADMRLAKNME
ncbi:MAG: TolC family protein [candidate division Zixibacteria bacterium]|nr:TolC family protein [candidate division Zixibacteria bacterium]